MFSLLHTDVFAPWKRRLFSDAATDEINLLGNHDTHREINKVSVYRAKKCADCENKAD